MFRKLSAIAVLSMGAAALSGCGAAGFAFLNRPVLGAPSVYASTSSYEFINEQTKLGTKSGEGCATSILGIITTGDTALADIARKANISRVTHIDHKFENILGIYAKYCIYVYGE